MLKLEKVNKSFAETNNHEVLKNIDFSVADGEFVCILGPSGCGKTVLLYLLAGFLQPTSGEILIDGRKLGKPGTDRIMIFQDYVLYPWLDVKQNIVLGLSKKNISPQKKNELVSKYLEMVGLDKYADWYPHALSGGMKQRVAIARALIAEPKILLMDEPFAALDSQYRKYMRQNLEKIWQKNPKTILFVTHSINEALCLADTIYVLSSLPAQIKKVYRISLPRPRDPRDPKFLELASQIEEETMKEFSRSMEQNPASERALKLILEKVV